MNRIFRAVLEDESSSPDPEEQAMIVMKGPLADVYAQALDIAMAKDGCSAEGASEAVQAVLESFKLKVEGQALETAQMDSVLMQHMAAALVGDETQAPADASSVFAVSHADVTDDIMVEVVKEAVASTDETQPGEFVLIVDATQPGANGHGGDAPSERVALLSQALETMVVNLGGQVFHSLKDYAASRAHMKPKA